MKNQFLQAGKIVNTFGVAGEVKIQPWADSPDVLQHLPCLYLEDQTPLRLLRGRVHKGCLIAAFEGVGDLNAAMTLKNRVVYLNRDDVPLPNNGYFLADVIGADVLNDDGTPLGTLADILELPQGTVFVVRGQREILIPNVPAFVRDVNTDSGVVTVHLIEGL